MIVVVLLLLLLLFEEDQVSSFSTTTTTTTTSTSTSTSTIPMRVASWNVLSQQSVKVDMEMETKLQQQQNRRQQKHLLQEEVEDEDDDDQEDDEEEEDYLEWKYRKPLISKILLNTLNADIICLQEVDTIMLQELMDDVGEYYTSCCVCTNDEVKVDGDDDDCQNVIILVRKDCPFQIKQCKVLSSTSILAVLECCNTFLYVANVHLQSTKGQLVASFGNDSRHEQLKTVLQSIASEEFGASKDANIVVAGDFNMLRYNPFHQKLREGNFISLDDDDNDDYDEPSFPPLVDPYYDLQQKEQDCVPLYTSGGPKKKSYTYVKPDPLYLQKTTKGGSIVDYIFTTSYERAYLCHTESKFKASIDWPSADNPSDHVPIAIDMEVHVAANTNTTTTTTTTATATKNAEDDKNKKYDSQAQPEATDKTPSATTTSTTTKTPTTTTKDKRRQPKPSDEEVELAARYAAIPDIGERAYRILLDLDMV
jgi:hypothetical protein